MTKDKRLHRLIAAMDEISKEHSLHLSTTIKHATVAICYRLEGIEDELYKQRTEK